MAAAITRLIKIESAVGYAGRALASTWPVHSPVRRQSADRAIRTADGFISACARSTPSPAPRRLTRPAILSRNRAQIDDGGYLQASRMQLEAVA